MAIELIHARFEDALPAMADESFDLICIDPPFNTGRAQTRTQIATVRDTDGDRLGFHAERYRTVKVGTRSFADRFDDYLAFLEPGLVAAHRLLRPEGSFFLHLDYREVHYAKVLLDPVERSRLVVIVNAAGAPSTTFRSSRPRLASRFTSRSDARASRSASVELGTLGLSNGENSTALVPSLQTIFIATRTRPSGSRSIRPAARGGRRM